MRIKDLGNTATDFASDDYFAIDGATNASRKIKNDSLLKVTSQKAIAGNIAVAFDASKPNDAGGYAYYAGQKTIYNGETFLFIIDKTSGAWDSSYVVKTDALKLFEPKRHYNADDIITGSYIGGSVGSKITKTTYSLSYAENGFVIIPVTEGEHVSLKSLSTASNINNFIVTDSEFTITYLQSYDSSPDKVFNYEIEEDGYIICNSLPANFSFDGFYDEAKVVNFSSKLYEKKFSFAGNDLEIAWVYRNDPVTKVQPSISYRNNGCLCIKVNAGDQLIIKGSPTTTDYVLILTDPSSNVISTYAKGTLDDLTNVIIENSGYAYINSLPSNFECYYLSVLEKEAIVNIRNKKTFSYSDLIDSKTFVSANIGFDAPSISGSGLNCGKVIKVSAGDILTITSKIQGSANLLYLTDTNNKIRAAFTKEMVKSRIKVKYDGEALVSCEKNGTFELIQETGKPEGFVIKKPISLEKPAADGSADSNFDAEDMTTQDIYNALDALSSKYPYLLTSKILGKDASNTLDVKEYVFAQRAFLAWERDNYPKMYAFKFGANVVYCEKPSPRVGDSLYSTAYIGTPYLSVTSVSPNAWTLSDSNEYTRDSASDVEPTLIFTMVGDGLHVYYSNGYYRNASATQSGDDIVYSGNTYHRNHLYDTRRGEDYDYKICIGCAEHGPTTDPRDTAITLYNFIRDLCENAGNSDYLNYIRNNVLISFIPVINPWGFDNGVNGRRNYNGVNINRNYNTPGWSNLQEDPGAYPGSEIETQYAMGMFAARNWEGSLSIHCLGNGNTGKLIMYGAPFVDPMLDIANAINYYGILFTASVGDNPLTSCTSNAYQKLVGLTGILIELNRGPDNGDKHTAIIETMNCTYLMLTLWYIMSLKQ